MFFLRWIIELGRVQYWVSGADVTGV